MKTTDRMYQKSIHKERPIPPTASAPRLKERPRPTPENPMIVSASELREWLRCRVKHAWRYRMDLAPKTGTEALFVGTLVHTILDGWYRLPWKRRTTEAMKTIARAVLRKTTPDLLEVEDLELVRAMCVGYPEWARPLDRDLGIREAFPDDWFAVPLDAKKTIIVRGKLDLRFEIASLKRALGCQEFKTASAIRGNDVETNLQLSIYLWAMRRRFPKYRRYVAYRTILRKQLPGPRVKAALFNREAVERGEEEIEQWEVDTRRIAAEMLDGAIYPTPMENCGWDCDFRIPCLLRGLPADLDHVLKTQYVNRRSREIL